MTAKRIVEAYKLLTQDMNMDELEKFTRGYLNQLSDVQIMELMDFLLKVNKDHPELLINKQQ